MHSNPLATLELGTVIDGKWVILEFIGKGGMGEVYRAHQVNLRRDVAIKIISREFLGTLDGETEELETALDRFRREIQLMAQTRHPNVLQIFDSGSASVKVGDEDTPIEYIVIEYVPGDTLRATMPDEGFYPDENAVRDWLSRYFLPLLDGVQAMHKLGIVHRDLKPENVLLDGNSPKIADFGLARSSRWKALTRSLDIRGTPCYMSPEHFFDLKGTDQRADVYSLGKILFEAVSGRIPSGAVPFRSTALPKAETIFFQHLDRTVQHATAEERDQRIRSAKELSRALAELLDHGEKSFAPPRKPRDKKTRWRNAVLLAVALVLLISGLIGYQIFSHRKTATKPVPAEKVSPYDALQRPVFEDEEGKSPPRRERTPRGSTLHEGDGATLHVIPGGKVTLPEGVGPRAGESLEIAAFYLDETQVTNHQYVGFLNQVLPRISVERGVVQGDGEIWLLLGEVIEGYEPIVFEEEKFSINNPAHAGCAVLRVTGYGAAAYANFYGRRLPMEFEWLHAREPKEDSEAASQQNVPDRSEGMGMGEMHDRMYGPMTVPTPRAKPDLPVPSPVILFKPNRYGIRGMDEGLREWGLRVPHVLAEEGRDGPEFVVLGKHQNASAEQRTESFAVPRHPWEAFEDVGFRCALDAPLDLATER